MFLTASRDGAVTSLSSSTGRAMVTTMIEVRILSLGLVLVNFIVKPEELYKIYEKSREDV